MVDGPTPLQWTELRARRPVSEDAFATIPISVGEQLTPLAYAIDVTGNLHLLIPVERGPSDAMPPDLNGLRVRHRQLDSGCMVDLIANASHETVFNAVCQDVIEAVVVQGREPWAAIAATIRKWQSAWRPARQAMEKTAQVGLFGELFVLQTVLLPVLGPAAVALWSGPEGERHDFVGERLHIEVKATRGTRPEHQISRVDQLRVAEGCELMVASILLEESIGGDETLASRIDAIINLLRKDTVALDTFMTKLVDVGWAEEMRHTGELLRFFLRDASVHLVDDNFPRLPDDFQLPSGVVSVKYVVNLANLPVLDITEVAAIVRRASALKPY